MKRILTPLPNIVLLTFVLPLYADFGVTNHGTWPDSWPRELEPLRKQSRTLEGPTRLLLAYAIPSTSALIRLATLTQGEKQRSTYRSTP